MGKNNMRDIMVSIVCITYNHEEYIKNALDGFLSQKTIFKYEIIIHDDASTDRTAEIVQDYEKKYPDIIRGIYQVKNQYSKKRSYLVREVLRECRGKYIALCEGDDFWIDKHKLQIQVGWMEAHPEYWLTVHNAVCLNCAENTLKPIDSFCSTKTIEIEEFIEQSGEYAATASMVLRADIVEMKDFFWECGVADWPLQFLCVTKGNVYYFDRIMSIYRFSHKGSWTEIWLKNPSKFLEHCIEMIVFLEKYNVNTNYVYEKYIVTRVQMYAYWALNSHEKIFFKIIDQFNSDDSYEHKNYLKELKRIFRQISDTKFLDKNLQIFISKFKHIILFGAGDYASRLAKQLSNHKIEFEGFAVSDIKEDNYLGKPVWQLDNIPFDSDEVGVIVAIRPVKWYLLVETLMQNNIVEYICPFLFDMINHNAIEAKNGCYF